MADANYKIIAEKLGVDPNDIPEEETEQPEDVAEVRDQAYGDCD